VIDSEAAARYGLEPGDKLTFRFLTPDELAEVYETGLFDAKADPEVAGTGPLVSFTVTGVRTGLDLGGASIVLTPAFWQAYGEEIAVLYQENLVRLARGKDDVPAFADAVRRSAAGEQVTLSAGDDLTVAIRRTLDLQSHALALIAALAGVAVAIVVLQALSRQATVEARALPTLWALGMSRRQLLALGLARSAMIGLAAAALGCLVGIGLSPLAPVGLARSIEPHPGLDVDVTVFAIGVPAIAILVVLLSVVPIRRSVRRVCRTSERRRTSSTPHRAERLSGRLPVTAYAGLRLGFGRSSTARAGLVRSAAIGAISAVAVVAAALTFSASLNHLLEHPRLYGQTFDGWIGTGFGPDFYDAYVPALVNESDIEALSFGTITAGQLAGEEVGILALDEAKGRLGPPIVEGRLPSTPEEVALGVKTFDDIGLELGEKATLAVGGGQAEMVVVGRVVLPEAGFTGLSLGDGAAMTFGGLRQLVPDAPRNVFLLRFEEGTDPEQALAALPSDYGVASPFRPADLGNFGRVESMPWIVAALFAALAVLALVHTLLVLSMARRRDLAVLRALGLVRGQVIATIGWQAALLALVGLVVGLPLGLGAGRWIWGLFAEQLGVIRVPVVPAWSLLIVVPAALVLAILASALPAAVALRGRPAVLLRAE
jgi:ABC-type lipoprotein release transport system permease subunit